MYLLILTYNAPMEEIDKLLSAHRHYLDKNYAAGHFIASGRQNPRTGGVILCRTASRAQTEQIIREDPFNAVASYQIIEFEPSKCMAGLESIMLE
ncbi:MAG TPA: YciI family protein [Bacteroidales bacterium]